MKKRFMTESDILGLGLSATDKRIELFNKPRPLSNASVSYESLEDLLKREEQRVKDGFTKKIKIHKTLAGANKLIMVPFVEEAQLIHGEFEPSSDWDSAPGSGSEEVGDLIEEEAISEEDNGSDKSSGGSEEGEHQIETEIHEAGKILSEKFNLPNLKNKGKKISTDEYVYDLTDRHRGSGQLLDKKATLKRIIKTNSAIGLIGKKNIDPTKIVVSPKEKIFRTLSREKVWKSQAIVFFVRDYSGSMSGEPTKAVLNQHSMIYLWLLIQYEKQYEKLVIPRFIVHSSESEEVSAKDYFRKSDSGGTLIGSSYQKINEIVEKEGLANDYNIYIFHGTDGDDWDTEGKIAIPEIKKIISYVNRMGVCIVKESVKVTHFEKYIIQNKFNEKKDLFRMHTMQVKDATEENNVVAVKALIAQD